MLPFLNIFNKMVPMYGLCIVLGVAAASFFAVRECNKKSLMYENLILIAATGIGLGFLGAKLMYIFVTYSFSDLVEIIAAGNFDAILRGGFVFYGGLIFGILGALLGAKIAGARISEYENIAIKGIPLAHAFGRIGCFCAGCCYGKPTNFLGVIYPPNAISDVPVGIPLVPIQLYEAALNIIICITMHVIDKKYPTNRILTPLYLAAYAVVRVIVELFRYDEVRGVLWGISTSQFISMAMIAVAIVLFIVRKSKSKIPTEKKI